MFIAVVAMVVVGGSVFYACKKDGTGLLTNKSISNEVTVYENPFEQYGIWHNECLEEMFSHLYGENGDTLSIDELWITYGVPYFQKVLGANYVEIPLISLHAVSEKIIGLVEAKNMSSLIEEFVAKGKLNPNFTSPYLVAGTGNNYNLLLALFQFLDTVTVQTETVYLSVLDMIKECEQKIVTNYYSFLNNGVFVSEPEMLEEYEGAMLCMAVFGGSGNYWIEYYGVGVHVNSYEDLRRISNADGVAAIEALLNDEFCGRDINLNNGLLTGAYASAEAYGR